MKVTLIETQLLSEYVIRTFAVEKVQEPARLCCTADEQHKSKNAKASVVDCTLILQSYVKDMVQCRWKTWIGRQRLRVRGTTKSFTELDQQFCVLYHFLMAVFTVKL